jgi:hypothetical protein
LARDALDELPLGDRAGQDVVGASNGRDH